eukprot:Trichotokara_eunicae@DN5627_c0_g1_i1.p1
MFSLGVCLYFLIFGVLPWKEQEPQQCADLIRTSNAPYDRLQNEAPVSDALKELALALLAKNPAKRPTSSMVLTHNIFLREIADRSAIGNMKLVAVTEKKLMESTSVTGTPRKRSKRSDAAAAPVPGITKFLQAPAPRIPLSYGAYGGELVQFKRERSKSESIWSPSKSTGSE